MADFGKYYRSYMYMKDLLKSDFTHNYINASLKDGDKGKDTLDGKTREKVIDLDWVVAIEEALPYIQNAIDEQRRFIKQVENVVRIELARKVGPDSVKHLSQHTSFIAKVEDGMVTPNKILTVEREESFAIYENRVLMTLIHKALRFVDDKYSKMKDVPDDSYNKFSLVRELNFNQQKINVTIDYTNELHETLADDLDVLDVNALSDFDRIRRIRTTLNEFLTTPLMKEIAKEPQVRPPITQTNLLKKNPNFKKAMELWNFLDTYKRDGFEIVSEEYSGKMKDEIQNEVYFAVGFQHFMLSMATNPALRNILQQKYEDENKRLAELSAKPEKSRESVIKARIEAVRKEEMQIRLAEIREREKKILDLTNEIKNLKVTLDQKEQLILTLQGKVSALQDEILAVKEELNDVKIKLVKAQKEIKQLKKENQELKDKIEELNATIQSLNETIDGLNKQIIVLNDRIQVLMQENARQQTKINEQTKLINEQKEQITGLETQVAENIAQITALNENLEKCNKKIEEDTKTITYLTDKTELLTNNLQKERKQSQERVTKMNEDFASRLQAIDNKHKEAVRILNQKIEDDNTAHNDFVTQLNSEFAEKESIAEQKRLNDLAEKQSEFDSKVEHIKKTNAENATEVNAKHVSEVRKVQRSVDKKVEEAEKAAEKRMQVKVNEIRKEAQAEIRKAEKKANEKIGVARDENRAIKGSVELFSKDYSLGTSGVMSAYAQILFDNENKNIGSLLSGISKNIKSVIISKSKKGVSLTLYSPLGVKPLKLYKKQIDLTVAASDACELIKGVKDVPICVTYSGVDKTTANQIASTIIDNKFTMLQNKNTKGEQFIAIYFCKD